MTVSGWAYMALVFVLVLAGALPLGLYIARILKGEVRFLAPIERGIYAACGINPDRPMYWQE